MLFLPLAAANPNNAKGTSSVSASDASVSVSGNQILAMQGNPTEKKPLLVRMPPGMEVHAQAKESPMPPARVPKSSNSQMLSVTPTVVGKAQQSAAMILNPKNSMSSKSSPAMIPTSNSSASTLAASKSKPVVVAKPSSPTPPSVQKLAVQRPFNQTQPPLPKVKGPTSSKSPNAQVKIARQSPFSSSTTSTDPSTSSTTISAVSSLPSPDTTRVIKSANPGLPLPSLPSPDTRNQGLPLPLPSLPSPDSGNQDLPLPSLPSPDTRNQDLPLPQPVPPQPSIDSADIPLPNPDTNRVIKIGKQILPQLPSPSQPSSTSSSTSVSESPTSSSDATATSESFPTERNLPSAAVMNGDGKSSSPPAPSLPSTNHDEPAIFTPVSSSTSSSGNLSSSLAGSSISAGGIVGIVISVVVTVMAAAGYIMYSRRSIDDDDGDALSAMQGLEEGKCANALPSFHLDHAHEKMSPMPLSLYSSGFVISELVAMKLQDSRRSQLGYDDSDSSHSTSSSSYGLLASTALAFASASSTRSEMSSAIQQVDPYQFRVSTVSTASSNLLSTTDQSQFPFQD